MSSRYKKFRNDHVNTELFQKRDVNQGRVALNWVKIFDTFSLKENSTDLKVIAKIIKWTVSDEDFGVRVFGKEMYSLAFHSVLTAFH